MIKDVLFGLAVGDAVGVPVEFTSRQTIRQMPVTDMIGYGTYNLPAGTWSDDSLEISVKLTTQFQKWRTAPRCPLISHQTDHPNPLSNKALVVH